MRCVERAVGDRGYCKFLSADRHFVGDVDNNKTVFRRISFAVIPGDRCGTIAIVFCDIAAVDPFVIGHDGEIDVGRERFA